MEPVITRVIEKLKVMFEPVADLAAVAVAPLPPVIEPVRVLASLGPSGSRGDGQEAEKALWGRGVLHSIERSERGSFRIWN